MISTGQLRWSRRLLALLVTVNLVLHGIIIFIAYDCSLMFGWNPADTQRYHSGHYCWTIRENWKNFTEKQLKGGKVLNNASMQLDQEIVKNTSMHLHQEIVKNASIQLGRKIVKNASIQQYQKIMKNASIQLDQGIVKNASVQLDQKIVKQASMQLDQEIVKNTSTQPDQEIRKNASTQLDQDIVKNASTQLDQEIVKNASTQLDQEIVKNASMQLDQGIVKNAITQIDKEIVKNASTQPDQEIVKNGSLQLDQEILKNASTQLDPGILKNASTQLDQEIVKNGSTQQDQEIVKNASLQLDPEILKNASTQLDQEIVKNGSMQLDLKILKNARMPLDQTFVKNSNMQLHVNQEIVKNASKQLSQVVSFRDVHTDQVKEDQVNNITYIVHGPLDFIPPVPDSSESTIVPSLTKRITEPYLKLPNITYNYKIAILTPMCDLEGVLERYFKLLSKLSYPHELISVYFGEDGSKDRTFDLATQLAADLKGKLGFNDAAAFHFNISHGKWDDDHIETIQLERRAHLAKTRNMLLDISLHVGKFDYVLWIDGDISDVPKDLVQQLIFAKRDVVVPTCLYEMGGHMQVYDLNTWRETPASLKYQQYLSPDMLLVEGYRPTLRIYLSDMRAEGRVVPLDGVGGCALLIKTECHRKGLIFPEKVYRNHIETEGLAKMAKDMGYSVAGMPFVEVFHFF